jgi:hypothetical protein
MTKIKSLFILTVLCLLPVSFCRAQTNTSAFASPTISGGLQQLWDATAASPKSAWTLGGGRGLHGNHNLIFLDYLYNFNDNAGLLLGFDDIASGTDFKSDSVAFVKGGFNVKAEIAPFARFGLPNFKVTPFVALLMYSANGDVGQIAVAGASHAWHIGKSWDLNVGAFYESRSGGNSETDGKYLCGMVTFSHGF